MPAADRGRGTTPARLGLRALPPETDHVIVGAGQGPCALLAVGTRTPDHTVVYPRSELARRHRTEVEAETDSPSEAYAPFSRPHPIAYRDGWLP
ncbi:MAG: hypothetical protein ACRDK9_07665 [Solirubrobacterales bacterium]